MCLPGTGRTDNAAPAASMITPVIAGVHRSPSGVAGDELTFNSPLRPAGVDCKRARQRVSRSGRSPNVPHYRGAAARMIGDGQETTELAGTARSILELKGTQVYSIGPAESVYEAVAKMSDQAGPLLAPPRLLVDRTCRIHAVRLHR